MAEKLLRELGFEDDVSERVQYLIAHHHTYDNIDKFSTASIVTRLTTDVTNVQNAYQMIIRIAIREPVMLLFSMVVEFRINREISIIFLLIISILGALLILIVKTVHPVFQRHLNFKLSGRFCQH